MMSVACPRIVGPGIDIDTLATANAITSTSSRRCGPSSVISRRADALKFFGLLRRPHPAERAAAIGGRGGALRPACRSCSCRLLAFLGLRRRRSRRRSGRSGPAAVRAACRRSCRLSSTRIWSAWRMLATRWATTIIAALGEPRCERRAQPCLGREVERRERVVEQVDCRVAQQRARDREPLALAARDVRPALGDRRRRAAPASRATKSFAWATSSASHSSSSVASGLPKRRFDATVPVNRYARCGTMPIRAHSSSGSRVAHVDAVDAAPCRRSDPTAAGSARRSVVLPAPVAPTIAVISPGRATNEMSREHRRGRARIAVLDAAELDARRCGSAGATGSGGARDLAGRYRAPRRCARRTPRRAGSMIDMNVAIITRDRICIR